MYHSQNDIDRLKSKLNNLDGVVRASVGQCTWKAFISMLGNVRNGPDLFKQFKRVSSYKSRTSNFESLQHGGRSFTSRAEQTEIFVKHLEKNHVDAAAGRDPEFSSSIKEKRFNDESPLLDFSADRSAVTVGIDDERFTTLASCSPEFKILQRNQ